MGINITIKKFLKKSYIKKRKTCGRIVRLL